MKKTEVQPVDGVILYGVDETDSDSVLPIKVDGIALKVSTTTSGTVFSQVFTGANQASGTVNSISVPAGITWASVQFNDIASSVLTKLGVTVGSYTEAEAGVAIAALFAGTSAEGTVQISINDEMQAEYSVSDAATLIAWNSTGVDTGANEVIVSWKV